MSPSACKVPPQELVAYWLDELDTEPAQRFEEHLFGCAACTDRLGELAALGTSIRRELLHGRFGFVLPEAFVDRVKGLGLRVREYRLDPGASVDCTIARDDDLVVAYLRAPLADVRRLDVLIDDPNLGSVRVSDVPFDPAADGVMTVPGAGYLRTLRHNVQRARLVAVDGPQERVLGDYTFRHYPSP